MKTVIHLPTAQFEFIEQEFDKYMTPEEVKIEYNKLKEVLLDNRPDVSLAFTDYLCTLIDNDLSGKEYWGSPEGYAERPPNEQRIIQELKKFYKRLNAHLKEDKTY